MDGQKLYRHRCIGFWLSAFSLVLSRDFVSSGFAHTLWNWNQRRWKYGNRGYFAKRMINGEKAGNRGNTDNSVERLEMGGIVKIPLWTVVRRGTGGSLETGERMWTDGNVGQHGWGRGRRVTPGNPGNLWKIWVVGEQELTFGNREDFDNVSFIIFRLACYGSQKNATN